MSDSTKLCFCHSYIIPAKKKNFQRIQQLLFYLFDKNESTAKVFKNENRKTFRIKANDRELS